MLEMIILSFLSLILSKISLEMNLFLLSIFFLLFLLLDLEDFSSFCFMIDELSYSMIFLSLLLWIFVLISSMNSSSGMSIYISLLFFLTIFFFLSVNFLIFFVTFEMSLMPLLYIIMMYGNQAERVVSTQFLILYTIVASTPLLGFFIFYSVMESTSMNVLFETLWIYMNWFVLLSVISFFVKIPVFFLHSWLLKAHVEAPLEGSMILAGILLKVGLYGLVRMLTLFDITNLMMNILICVSLIGAIKSCFTSLSSDDLKMSVAFSSISHMNMIVPAIISMKMDGMTSSIIIMVSHGVSSPLLFFYVTKIYNYSNSRSVLISKGLASKLPLFSFIGIILWSMNLSIPPYYSFIGELKIFSSVFSTISISWLMLVLFIFLNSFFSILNYGIQSHSSMKLASKKNYYDLLFLQLTMIVLLLMVFMFFFKII